MKRFGTLSTVLVTLFILLGLNGTLGETLEKAIESWFMKDRPVYIEKHVPAPTATPSATPLQTETKQ